MNTTQQSDTAKLTADVSVAIESIKIIRDDIKKMMTDLSDLSKELRSNFVSNQTFDLVKQSIPTIETLNGTYVSVKDYQSLLKQFEDLKSSIYKGVGIILTAVMLAILKLIIIK